MAQVTSPNDSATPYIVTVGSTTVKGFTKREAMALQILQGLVVTSTRRYTSATTSDQQRAMVVRDAVAHADQLIATLNESAT